MSGQIIGPIGVLPTGGGSGALNVDGTAVGINVTTGSSVALPGLTTTASNTIVIVGGYANGQSGLGYSASGSTLGAFTFRGTSHGAAGEITTFWKLAASPLAGEVITVNFGGATSFATFVAFAAKNSPNTGAPFDTSGTVPFVATIGAGWPYVLTQTGDLLFQFDSLNSASAAPASVGWTVLYNTNFTLVQILAGQSGTITGPDPTVSGGGITFGDALRGT
jgi:hypothetical protein